MKCMKILKLDPNTLEVLGTYNTYREASESVNVGPNPIREAALRIHRHSTSGGYCWFALNKNTGLNHYGLLKNKDGNHLSLEEIKILLKQYTNGNHFTLLRLDPDTLEVLDTYNTYKEADAVFDCGVHSLGWACVYAWNGSKVAGYRWFAMDNATGLSYYEYNRYGKHFYMSLEELKEMLIEKGEIKEAI